MPSQLRVIKAGRKNQDAYDIRISLPEALINLYIYLYADVDESIYMERKYIKFHNALFKNNPSIKNYENEMSIEDIAEKSGLSPNKIKWNLGKYN